MDMNSNTPLDSSNLNSAAGSEAKMNDVGACPPPSQAQDGGFSSNMWSAGAGATNGLHSSCLTNVNKTDPSSAGDGDKNPPRRVSSSVSTANGGSTDSNNNSSHSHRSMLMSTLQNAQNSQFGLMNSNSNSNMLNNNNGFSFNNGNFHNMNMNPQAVMTQIMNASMINSNSSSMPLVNNQQSNFNNSFNETSFNKMPSTSNTTLDNLPLAIPPKLSKRQSKQSFAQKLMHVLSLEETQSAIRWMPNGHAFCVVDSTKLVENVLPAYFKEAKYPSFVRDC
jgi:hypothetical protein